MPTYAERMEIVKANEIRRYSHYTKLNLIDFLIKRGLIPEKYGNNKQVKAKKDIDLIRIIPGVRLRTSLYAFSSLLFLHQNSNF